jgi:TatA/E family protein of Tat protein translocase
VFTDILQPTHLLFVLVVALLVLGPKRLPEVARTLGSGLRDFRAAISGESDDDERSQPGHYSLGDGESPDVPPAGPTGEMPIPRESPPAADPGDARTPQRPVATAPTDQSLAPTQETASAEPVTQPTASPDDSAVPANPPEAATEVRPPEPDHQS